jgi:hypothetical protein
VAACSTDDFVTWRFEGIVLHYANLTDMVLGTQGPFHVERPKVNVAELWRVALLGGGVMEVW